MWQYNNTNELYHYGVLGMKWGKRSGNRYTRAAEVISRDAADLRKHGYHKEAAAVQKVADRKKAKGQRKEAIKKQYQKLQDSASFKERFVYNNATRKKAAKYVVDNNMTVKEATLKAQGDAWRNTGVLIGGAVGTIAVASLMKNM